MSNTCQIINHIKNFAGKNKLISDVNHLYISITNEYSLVLPTQKVKTFNGK